MVEELAFLIIDNLPCKHLVLSMEEALINFLQDDTRLDGELELEPMNPYNRMLVHRLADIFGFSHHSIGEGDERHLILERCSETSIPSILVSDLLWQYDDAQSPSCDNCMVEELASLIKDNLPCKHLVLSMEEALINFLQDDTRFSHYSVGEGDERHLILERCSETSIPSVLVSDHLRQYDDVQSPGCGNCKDDENEISDEIEGLGGKNSEFKIQIKDENIIGNDNVYSVVKLSDDPMLVEKYQINESIKEEQGLEFYFDVEKTIGSDNKDVDENKIPDEIEGLEGKNSEFKIQIKDENITRNDNVYSVVKLSDDSTLVEKYQINESIKEEQGSEFYFDVEKTIGSNNKDVDENEIPDEIEGLGGKNSEFKIEIKDENITGNDNVYSVVKLSDDPTLVEKYQINESIKEEQGLEFYFDVEKTIGSDNKDSMCDNEEVTPVRTLSKRLAMDVTDDVIEIEGNGDGPSTKMSSTKGFKIIKRSSKQPDV